MRIHLSGNAYNRMKTTQNNVYTCISTSYLLVVFILKNEAEHCQHHAHKNNTQKNPKKTNVTVSGYDYIRILTDWSVNIKLSSLEERFMVRTNN